MTFEQRLVEIVGETHVLVDRDVVASYESDWTGRFRADARCVVRPGDTGEVASVVSACRDEGVQVCVQGGNTGLVGGSVPVDGAVVLSTKRLADVGEVDPLSAQVTVGAGATLAAVQSVVRKQGFDVGVDFAARESCTVGGMASTNAGGERVLRYGTMRAQVAGIEAVMPDGSVVSRLAGLPKDNTGFDLVSLLAGAEGTLGILTRLRLRLVPLLPGRAVALAAVGSTRDAVDLVVAARSLPSLEAAELFYADGLELVCAHTGLPAPFRPSTPGLCVARVRGSRGPGRRAARRTRVGRRCRPRRNGCDGRARSTRAVGISRVPHRVDQRRRCAGEARRRRADR